MNIQEVCKIRKAELKLTYQEISDTSGVPPVHRAELLFKVFQSPVYLHRRAYLQGAWDLT